MKEPSQNKRKLLEMTPRKTQRKRWFLMIFFLIFSKYCLFFKQDFSSQKIKLFLRTVNYFLVLTPQDLPQSGQRQHSLNISMFVPVNVYLLILLSNLVGDS